MNDGLMVKLQRTRELRSTARSVPHWLWLPNGATWWWSCCRSNRTHAGRGRQDSSRDPGHPGPWNLLTSGLGAWGREHRDQRNSPASPASSSRLSQNRTKPLGQAELGPAAMQTSAATVMRGPGARARPRSSRAAGILDGEAWWKRGFMLCKGRRGHRVVPDSCQGKHS